MRNPSLFAIKKPQNDYAPTNQHLPTSNKRNTDSAGASLSLLCTSDNDKVLANINCDEHDHVIIKCIETGYLNKILLMFDNPEITNECTAACPGRVYNFMIKTTLDFVNDRAISADYVVLPLKSSVQEDLPFIDNMIEKSLSYFTSWKKTMENPPPNTPFCSRIVSCQHLSKIMSSKKPLSLTLRGSCTSTGFIYCYICRRQSLNTLSMHTIQQSRNKDNMQYKILGYHISSVRLRWAFLSDCFFLHGSCIPICSACFAL